MKKITIKDIARIADVSRGTVDRVINNRGKVAPEVRDRIIKIAKELGYEKVTATLKQRIQQMLDEMRSKRSWAIALRRIQLV